MDCPQCKAELVMSERQGVEIDHCPKCRGVWLDRGELDKIIERSASYVSSERDDDDDDDRRQYDRRAYAPGPPPEYQYRKKKSFWSELFD